MSRRITRRQALGRLGALTAGGALAASHRPAHAQPAGLDPDPRFLIVISALGGASLIDGPLAIRHRECADWEGINCFPDAEVLSRPESPLRAVNLRRENAGVIPFPFEGRQSDFVLAHHQDMMVVTHTGTSVNHTIAQKRSLNGNSAWNGRTLQEIVAERYGRGLPLPNVNMSSQGYLEPGTDQSIPSWAVAEPVASPALWPLSLDGRRGVPGAPDPELVQLARDVRDEKLDPESLFHRTFRLAPALRRWQVQRGTQSPQLEGLDLITRLNLIPDTDAIPLSRFGLSAAADAARVREAFPRFLSDPFEAQGALAFLLLKNRAATTVTLGPEYGVLLSGAGLVNPPLAFDFSHTSHRAAQAIMWSRLYGVADKLIELLKAEPFDEARGESFWDRSLIYIATDFGRSKNRRGGADEFGSSHHLNNGSLIISPLVRGNTVLGGVDRDTGLTYGFDPRTGEPDEGREMNEPEVFAGILQALGVDTSTVDLPDMAAMRQG
jgi:uncharacterized protein (DUF1501 family)